MEKLYPKSIELTKNLIRQMKYVDEASVSLEVGEQLIETIEAQQQEIEQLDQDRINYQGQWAEACEEVLKQQQEIEQHIKWNEAHTKARVEQAERIKQLEEGLKGQRNFLKLLNDLGGLGYEKHGWITSHIKAIDALLGGSED